MDRRTAVLLVCMMVLVNSLKVTANNVTGHSGRDSKLKRHNTYRELSHKDKWIVVAASGSSKGSSSIPTVATTKASTPTSSTLSLLTSTIDEQCRDAIIERTFQSAIQGVVVSGIDGHCLSMILESQAVAYVEEDQLVHGDGNQFQPASWGLDRIDQYDWKKLDGIYHYTGSGSGVDVYVVDSGMRSTHREFDNRRKFPCVADLVTNEETNRGGQKQSLCQDLNNHGTAVAGIIGGLSTGVAKNVNMISVKVLDKQLRGRTSRVVEALDIIIRNKSRSRPTIVNMSLGTNINKALNDAVNRAFYNAGILVITSAGNDNTDACARSPASASGVLTVGSTKKMHDQRSPDSNFGPCVEVFAPGQNLHSASADGNQAYFDSYMGTSFAAAHVTGVAALYWEKYPHYSARMIRRAIIADGIQRVVPNPDNERLAPLINTIKISDVDPFCYGRGGFCLSSSDCCNGGCYRQNSCSLE